MSSIFLPTEPVVNVRTKQDVLDHLTAEMKKEVVEFVMEVEGLHYIRDIGKGNSHMQELNHFNLKVSLSNGKTPSRDSLIGCRTLRLSQRGVFRTTNTILAEKEGFR